MISRVEPNRKKIVPGKMRRGAKLRARQNKHGYRVDDDLESDGE